MSLTAERFTSRKPVLSARKIIQEYFIAEAEQKAEDDDIEAEYADVYFGDSIYDLCFFTPLEEKLLDGRWARESLESTRRYSDRIFEDSHLFESETAFAVR